MLRELGAKDVYGIDPDGQALEEALDAGILDPTHALHCSLQNIPIERRGVIDVIAAFNCIMDDELYQGFAEAAYFYLAPDGQMVMTFAEDKPLCR